MQILGLLVVCVSLVMMVVIAFVDPPVKEWLKCLRDWINKSPVACSIMLAIRRVGGKLREWVSILPWWLRDLIEFLRPLPHGLLSAWKRRRLINHAKQALNARRDEFRIDIFFHEFGTRLKLMADTSYDDDWYVDFYFVCDWAGRRLESFHVQTTTPALSRLAAGTSTAKDLECWKLLVPAMRDDIENKIAVAQQTYPQIESFWIPRQPLGG